MTVAMSPVKSGSLLHTLEGGKSLTFTYAGKRMSLYCIQEVARREGLDDRGKRYEGLMAWVKKGGRRGGTGRWLN